MSVYRDLLRVFDNFRRTIEPPVTMKEPLCEHCLNTVMIRSRDKVKNNFERKHQISNWNNQLFLEMVKVSLDSFCRIISTAGDNLI